MGFLSEVKATHRAELVRSVHGALICSTLLQGSGGALETPALRWPGGCEMIPNFTPWLVGRTMRLAWRKVLWSAGLLALSNCSGDEEPRRGQLMLALQTDMSIPKDVNRIRLQVFVGDSLQ